MPRYRLLLISGVVGLALAGCDNAQKTAAVDLRQCPKTDAQACATIAPAAPAAPAATPAKPAAGKDTGKTAPAKAGSAKTGASSTTTVVKTTTTKQAAATGGHAVRVERRGTYAGVAANGRHGRHVGRGYATGVHGETHGTYQRYHGEELLGGQDDRVTIERRYAGRPDLDNTQVYGGQTYGSKAFDGREDNRVTVERGYGRREEFNGYSRPLDDHDRGGYRSNSDAARALAQRDEHHGARGYGQLPPPPPPPPLPPPPPRPPLPPRPPVIYQDGRSHVQAGSTYSYEEQSRESHRSSSEQYSSGVVGGGVVGGGHVVVKRRGPPLPPPPLARVPDGSYGPTSDLDGYRRAGQDDRGFLNWAGKVEY